VATSPQPQPSPLTPAEWEVEFRRAISADFQTHDDPAIAQLLLDSDNTFEHTAVHVRRFVTDFWKEINEDRSLYGAELRGKLPSAIAGQKTTISVLEMEGTQLDESGFDRQVPIQINTRQYLQNARELLAQLEYMRDHAPAAFSIKSLGYGISGTGAIRPSDLQTLYSLHCFLRYRLGECSFDTLATLLDCGFTLEGIDKEVYDGKNLKNRLDGFRQNKWLAEQTEAAARSIPQVKPRNK